MGTPDAYCALENLSHQEAWPVLISCINLYKLELDDSRRQVVQSIRKDVEARVSTQKKLATERQNMQSETKENAKQLYLLCFLFSGISGCNILIMNAGPDDDIFITKIFFVFFALLAIISFLGGKLKGDSARFENAPSYKPEDDPVYAQLCSEIREIEIFYEQANKKITQLISGAKSRALSPPLRLPPLHPAR